MKLKDKATGEITYIGFHEAQIALQEGTVEVLNDEEQGDAADTGETREAEPAKAKPAAPVPEVVVVLESAVKGANKA